MLKSPAMKLNRDRAAFVPRHMGPRTLPNTTLFTRLLRYSSEKRPAIRDCRLNLEKTHLHLLTDVLALRQALEKSLPTEIQTAIQQDDEVFIGVLAPGGYEYTVAVLAIMALGAAVVPMAMNLPLEEASYFVLQSRQSAILSSANASVQAKALCRFLNGKGYGIPLVEISHHLQDRPLDAAQISISSDQYMDPNGSGLAIFTSGTTGPPKGAVMRRGTVLDAALAFAEDHGLSKLDTVLHVLPVHHATGITITFFPFLLSGACIEFRSGSFDAAWIWQRLRQGGITVFSGVPTIYMRLAKFFTRSLSKLPIRQEYVTGVNNLRWMLCGTSALPRPVQNFWTELRNGKMILTRYGATEIGTVFQVSPQCTDILEGSVGTAVPGVDVKLSNGDEGHILVRSPYAFSKYLFDEKATRNTHNAEGYFKTGDIGRREGIFYFIEGRASLDIIKSGGYKISALDIERECLTLPYVSEVMVVGVADDEFGQRVAALISLEEEFIHKPQYDGETRPRLKLRTLRSDLRAKLAGYKLPTLLRVVEGELPKTASGKVQKKLLGPRFFPSPGWDCEPDVQVWTSQWTRPEARL